MRILLDALSGCNEKQIRKINNIVTTMHNRLSQAEEQLKAKPPVKSRAVKGVDTDLVQMIKDGSYNSTVALEFNLKTGNMEPDKVYSLIALNQSIKSIIANGADSRTYPETLLSNYGNLYVEGNVVKFDCLLKPTKDLFYVYLVGCEGSFEGE